MNNKYLLCHALIALTAVENLDVVYSQLSKMMYTIENLLFMTN